MGHTTSKIAVQEACQNIENWVANPDNQDLPFDALIQAVKGFVIDGEIKFGSGHITQSFWCEKTAEQLLQALYIDTDKNTATVNIEWAGPFGKRGGCYYSAGEGGTSWWNH
jgi:hypothetical protein